MERYKNLGGNSEISEYAIGNDSIIVQLSNGTVYLYNYRSAGSDNVEQMKQLAMAGEGLYKFIDRNARMSYAMKLR